jgi:hypothetical protein
LVAVVLVALPLELEELTALIQSFLQSLPQAVVVAVFVTLAVALAQTAAQAVAAVGLITLLAVLHHHQDKVTLAEKQQQTTLHIAQAVVVAVQVSLVVIHQEL